jgi:hypothetical protein
MRTRNRGLTNVLLGAGIYLLDTMRGRLSENMEGWRERARDTYDVASERASRVSAALRGEDSRVLSNAAALLLGVGVGVGVGILLAPASGEETRRNIADEVQEFGDKARGRMREAKRATGTHGE